MQRFAAGLPAKVVEFLSMEPLAKIMLSRDLRVGIADFRIELPKLY
jgi:hypothetical protein